ncbi:MAG: helix-turn-helix transcriptional regulator [Saprospiraceae bacterium]|nr:helix-turn-helix transcriptional regulator [Saprospiraceae bacterium]
MMVDHLGEFEELMLTMVAILDQEAYGNAIVQAVKDQLDRNVNLSAVHITLYRLQDKGLVTSEMGGATTNRGGRRKRFFRITNAGKRKLNELQEQRLKLWKMLPELKFVVR